MIHNVILGVCIAAALALLFTVLWTMIGHRANSPGGFFSTHTFMRPIGLPRLARRRTGKVIVGTPDNSLPGGWSLIQRSMRARRDIRLAAR
jgi:hypothetical protein